VSLSGEWWGKVEDVVFQGSSALALDGKGRVTVPVRHRDQLAALCHNQLTLTKHPKGYLLVFPRPAWVRFRDQLLAMPFQADDWRRIFMGSADDVEIDAGARILVSPELRQFAGLDKNVMLLGVGHRLELWDAARYAAHEAKVMAGEVPEAIQNFVF
jgi:MraZ protein